MKKIYSIFFLCAIFHLANAQLVTFPDVKKGEYRYIIETEEHWKPTSQFKRANPDILTRGTFFLSKNKYWNSNSYPAVLCRNNIDIIAPGRIFIMFNGDEMPDLDGSESEKYPNGMDFIPLYSDEDCMNWRLGTKIYSNQGLYNIDIKFSGKFLDVQDKYISLNNAYKNAVARAFSTHRFSNYTTQPLASFNLAKEEISAADLFFEFSIDGVWTNAKGGGKEIQGETFDYGCFYKLAIRDCSGKILKTYGQSVFSGFLCHQKYFPSEVDFSNAIFFGYTYSAAIECLLSQYAVDNDIKKEIAKRTTALRIQTYSDKSIIQLFKLKSEANHFRHCQMNVIYGLNELDQYIKRLGGQGLDLSNIKMPVNSNPRIISQTQFDKGSSVVAGVAGVTSLIVNQSEKAKIRDFSDEAEKYKATFSRFVESEEKAVAAYNKLVQAAPTTDVSQIGNPGLASGSNSNKDNVSQIAPDADLEHYWDEGNSAANNSQNRQTNTSQPNYGSSRQNTQPQEPQSTQYAQPQAPQTTQNAPSQERKSGTPDFWDDAGAAKTNTTAKTNQTSTANSLKPISTSSDLQNNFDKADQSLSQSTANSLNKINSVEKGNMAWTNSTFEKYKADLDAAAAKKNSEKGGKKGSQNGCPQAEACAECDVKQVEKKCSIYSSSSCVKQCQVDCMKKYLEYCPDSFTEDDKKKIQQVISVTENEIRNMR